MLPRLLVKAAALESGFVPWVASKVSTHPWVSALTEEARRRGAEGALHGRYPGMVGWRHEPEKFWQEAQKRKIHPGAAGIVSPVLQMRQSGMPIIQPGADGLRTFIDPATDEFMWEKYEPFARSMMSAAARPTGRGRTEEEQQIILQLPQWQVQMQQFMPGATPGQFIERGFTQGDGGKWEFDPQKMWGSAVGDIQALRQAGFQDPAQFGQWAGGVQQFMEQYGGALPQGLQDPQSLIEQFKSTDGSLSADRIRGFKKLTDFFTGSVEGTKGYVEEIQEAGLDPSRVIGMASQWGLGAEAYKIRDSNWYDFGKIKEHLKTSTHALDILEELKEEGLDPRVLMEFKGSGDLQGVLKALGDEEQTALDVIKARYGGLAESGAREAKARELFKRDMQGAIEVAPKIKSVKAGFDEVFAGLSDEQRAGLGLDSPGAMIKNYVQKNGEIDFDSLSGELDFWDKALDMVSGDEKLKEKFINTAGLMNRFNGIGFLKNGRNMAIRNFKNVFMDKEGNIRTNAFKAALTVGSWGETLFKKLIDERDPMAWLGVLGVGIGALGLLKGIFGMPQPMPGMMPGMMPGAATAPGVAGMRLQFPAAGEHRTPTEWLQMLGGGKEPAEIGYL